MGFSSAIFGRNRVVTCFSFLLRAVLFIVSTHTQKNKCCRPNVPWTLACIFIFHIHVWWWRREFGWSVTLAFEQYVRSAVCEHLCWLLLMTLAIEDAVLVYSYIYDSSNINRPSLDESTKRTSVRCTYLHRLMSNNGVFEKKSFSNWRRFLRSWKRKESDVNTSFILTTLMANDVDLWLVLTRCSTHCLI